MGIKYLLALVIFDRIFKCELLRKLVLKMHYKSLSSSIHGLNILECYFSDPNTNYTTTGYKLASDENGQVFRKIINENKLRMKNLEVNKLQDNLCKSRSDLPINGNSKGYNQKAEFSTCIRAKNNCSSARVSSSIDTIDKSELRTVYEKAFKTGAEKLLKQGIQHPKFEIKNRLRIEEFENRIRKTKLFKSCKLLKARKKDSISSISALRELKKHQTLKKNRKLRIHHLTLWERCIRLSELKNTQIEYYSRNLENLLVLMKRVQLSISEGK